jgi:hypothetical protein
LYAGDPGWLEQNCNAKDWRIKAMANLAAAVVAGSRQYLTLLMKSGGWLSSAFSRQMVFSNTCRLTYGRAGNILIGGRMKHKFNDDIYCRTLEKWENETVFTPHHPGSLQEAPIVIR